MFNVDRYHGFCRLAVYTARFVAHWPIVADKLAAQMFSDRALTVREIVLSFRQEAALAQGASMEDVLTMTNWGET